MAARGDAWYDAPCDRPDGCKLRGDGGGVSQAETRQNPSMFNKRWLAFDRVLSWRIAFSET